MRKGLHSGCLLGLEDTHNVFCQEILNVNIILKVTNGDFSLFVLICWSNSHKPKDIQLKAEKS